MQMAFQYASRLDPTAAQQIGMELMQMSGGEMTMNMGGAVPHMIQTDNLGGIPKNEHAFAARARQQANEAAQPDSGAVLATKR